MNTKNMQNDPMDGTKFLEILSTISLGEILQFEFRNNPSKKWQLLITATDGKYVCTACLGVNTF